MPYQCIHVVVLYACIFIIAIVIVIAITSVIVIVIAIGHDGQYVVYLLLVLNITHIHDRKLDVLPMTALLGLCQVFMDTLYCMA